MEDSVAEVREDYDRLHKLYTAAHGRIEEFCKHLSKAEGSYAVPTYIYLQSQAAGLRATLSTISIELGQALKNDALWNAQHEAALVQKKKEYSDVLRTLHSTLGGLLSAGNWQSPSFWHSGIPQAGNDAGVVTASSNDYKRDMHKDEKRYGQLFVKEYVDHPLRLAPLAFATSSGMSAVTTVLTSLQSTYGREAVVVAGKASYFQNKWQLETLFPGHVHFVDEFDTEGIVQTVERLQPSIVFLDSLCGAQSLAMPNLSVLIPKLLNALSSRSTFVLDNTVLATSYQPLRDLPHTPLGGMHLVVIESLLKFHQFGFDRVGGGIVWAPVGSEHGLFEARMHLGTIIPDASVLTLPLPDRKLFDTRLARIGRNARLLAQKLDEYVEKEKVSGNSKGSVSRIVHPSLPSYPGYTWTKDLPFQGPFVTLVFKEGKQTVAAYDAFISRVQKAAEKRGVDVIGGTSFGFDTTRLYVTARYATGITMPFVRISVGTETQSEIETLIRVFEEALS